MEAARRIITTGVPVGIVGAGYVGAVTAACLASLGHRVTVVDHDDLRITRLRSGRAPFTEPNLDRLIREGVATSRLRFETELEALAGCRLVIVAVGTLDRDGAWTGDLVRNAVLAIAAHPSLPRRIAIRSTLLPGTAVRLAEEVRLVDASVRLAVNPEFTREGSAVRDFLEPDRIVLGLQPEDAGSGLLADLQALYASLAAPAVVTDLTSAETIKLASNVFLATKIAFANEMARFCAAVDADVSAVVDGMGMDPRIGRSFLTPGPGFGGSCFPSQVRALPALMRAHGVGPLLIGSVAASNDVQTEWVVDRLEAAMGVGLRDRCVTLLGLTFKAGTDDLRESPALRLAREVHRRGACLAVHDPVALESGVGVLRSAGVEVVGHRDAALACEGADALIVATEWAEYGRLAWPEIAARMRGRWVADTRQIVDASLAGEAGLVVLRHGAIRAEPGVPAGSAA